MKSVNKFSTVLIIVVALTAGCMETETGPATVYEPAPRNLLVRFTSFRGEQVGSKCYESENWIRNRQTGHGVASVIGAFDAELSFCFCEKGKECGKYENGSGYFVAVSGDTLFFAFSGRARMFKNGETEGYSGEMDDPFFITGGTGIYKDVSGDGFIKSRFTSDMSRIDHLWNGKLTFR